MIDNIFILNEKSIAIELDARKKLVYFYHFISQEIVRSSKSILLTIDSETLNEINKHFSVDIQEYGVAVDDAAPYNVPICQDQFKFSFYSTSYATPSNTLLASKHLLLAPL